MLKKFKQFCVEVYDEMPRPVQKYYDWMGKIWTATKPFLRDLFWYVLAIYVFITIYNKRGFETTIVILMVSLIFSLRRSK